MEWYEADDHVEIVVLQSPYAVQEKPCGREGSVANGYNNLWSQRFIFLVTVCFLQTHGRKSLKHFSNTFINNRFGRNFFIPTKMRDHQCRKQ